MKILGHIHSFNDEDVIERSLQALLDQTHPLHEIVIVDNGSTDRTLERVFPRPVTVIRHEENRGTSGAVVTGFQYALDHGYDWIWIFDADTAPRNDALEKLLSLYMTLGPKLRPQIRVLASLPVSSVDQRQFHASRFTSKGMETIQPSPGQACYEFDATIWTGCLFNMKAVRRIGLPSTDYVLDIGEFEYGYKGKKYGLKAFLCLASVVDHNIGGYESLQVRTYRLGPLAFKAFNLPPIRCYYLTRNVIYFWLYVYEERTLAIALIKLLKVFLVTLNFLLRPVHHTPHIRACLRGIWDGLWKQMQKRY